MQQVRNSRRLRVIAVAVALTSLIAAACSGSDDQTGSGGEDEKADPNGVLRIGADLQRGGGVFFDMTAHKETSGVWVYPVYDTLLRVKADGSVGPGLAKSANVVDASTIDVELQSGVKFSDGTPMDAEAVKFGIERNVAPGPSGAFEVELFQLASVTVTSPTKLTIKLKTPIAGAWFRLLHLPETSPVSPTAAKAAGANLDSKPVGAGPFVVDSQTPGQLLKLRKNETYFQADRVRLAAVEYVHVGAAALVNAFRSGAIDNAPITTLNATELVGAPGIKTEVQASDVNLLQGMLCKNRAPFNDLRVRQALNYATDRAALSTLYTEAEPMWGFWSSDSPFHNKDLDGYYAYDPDKAKKLLAEAGVPNLKVDSFYLPPNSDAQQVAEVLQQQWAKVGVTLTIKPLIQTADFFPDAKVAPMNIMNLQRTDLLKVTRVYVPGSFGNVCGWDDPKLNAFVTKLQALEPDSKEAVKTWHELQSYAFETAVSIFGLFTPQAKAWNEDRVGNAVFSQDAQGRPIFDFTEVFIKG